MKKLPTPKKLVRKVLSLTSNISTQNEETKTEPHSSTSKSEKNIQDIETLELELMGLREQTSFLQAAVKNMQEDAEKREKALANIAREKQQLAMDLKKEKRSTSNLQQQLHEEREFYYREKEHYCQEMNDCKKLKKKMSESIESMKKEIGNEDLEEAIEYKNKISKLQKRLDETLEANYNLGVRFMRMKNTKTNLTNQLKLQDDEYKEAMQRLQVAINNIKNDLADITDKRFMLPISPSNKKYLQVIKQNGMLMYENLCLQMEVDHLHKQIKNHRCNSDSNLKYQQKDTANNRIRFQNPKSTYSKTEIITIFERPPRSTDKSQNSECTEDASQHSELNKTESRTSTKVISGSQSSYTRNFRTASQMSSNVTGTDSSTFTFRSHSAPEIIQSSLYISKNKL